MSISSEFPDTSPGTRGTIAFRGTDAAKFLQGQLSADVLKLRHGSPTLAGLHNPQGRVIALLHLTRNSETEFLATLPRELAHPVISRLRKYVLRAKLTIDDAGDAPAVDELAAVRAGIPEVYAATSESFVAQMLNLDLLGGIAFDKGCYTGQEVIARAHYRGRVKRRAQRWLNNSGQLLRPGDAAQADGRSLSVVRVATLSRAGESVAQEILAVGTFLPRSATADAAVADTEATTTAATAMVTGPLPLPFELPE